jgi:sugar phosphate permease
MGVVPLVIIAIFVFDRPEQYRNMTEDDLEYAYRDELAAGALKKGQYANARETILKDSSVRFFDLFRNQSYVAVIFVDIVMQITLYGALTWIPLYLSDAFGFQLQTMGWWSGLYFVAGALGSFISSYMSDKVFHGNRKIMILACFIGLAPFVFLLGSLQHPTPALLAVALCGMGFFGNMAWGPFLALPAEIFSPEVYGKAMGFVNGAGYFVAAFSAKIFAALVTVDALGKKDYTYGWYFHCHLRRRRGNRGEPHQDQQERTATKRVPGSGFIGCRATGSARPVPC